MELKNKNKKNITKQIKKSYKKDCNNIIEIFLKIGKLKKEVMLALKIKIC